MVNRCCGFLCSEIKEMKKIGSESFKIVLAFVLTAGVFFAVWANFYSSGARQRQNLAIAQDFIDESIYPLIQQCKEFKNISASPYTGDGGCISISGLLKTKKEFRKLKDLVKKTNSLLLIRWRGVIVEEVLFNTEIKEKNSEQD